MNSAVRWVMTALSRNRTNDGVSHLSSGESVLSRLHTTIPKLFLVGESR